MAGKTRLRNDLLCVEWDVKLYTVTDSCKVWSSGLHGLRASSRHTDRHTDRSSVIVINIKDCYYYNSSVLSCPDTHESGVSDSVVPCDTTHVKIEKQCRATDELTTADDAASISRHLGMVSSSDAGLPPLMSIMPPVKRARWVKPGFHYPS